MRPLSRRQALLGLGFTALPSLTGAVRGDDVMYVGGTITEIPEKTEGKLDLQQEQDAVFFSKKGSVRIPFKTISSIEYGQKAGRRVGVAIAISPIALLSKKRKHFVSVGFVDASGTRQGVVFEVAKGRARAVLAVLETKSGKQTEFESEDARKHLPGGDD